MKSDLELSEMRYDIDSLANQICMDEGASEMYILVEGGSDKDVFAKFVKNDIVNFIICDGKANVLKVYILMHLNIL